MDNIFQSIFIGAVQGVSEFLPISSSGHLTILQNLFKWSPDGRLAFDVALHFGTAIAIIAFFWKDWLAIIARAFGTKSKTIENIPFDPEVAKYPKNLLWQILAASIPAAVVGFILNDYVETKLNSNLLISFNLIVFGLILWLVDKKSPKNFKLSTLSYRQSFLIGSVQAVALIPGVSRSGITMSMARAQGMDRQSAARFSFLLGTPAILGAFLFNLRHIAGINTGLAFWLGFAASTIFGFLAIKYLLQYLEKSDFTVFLWYRIAVAVIVTGLYLLH